MEFQIYDTVALASDLPGDGLSVGAVGAVIFVYDEPVRAYEVEFCDERGRTIAQIVLGEGDLRLVNNDGE